MHTLRDLLRPFAYAFSFALGTLGLAASPGMAKAQTVTVLGSTRDAPIYGAMQASDGNYYSSSTFPLTYSCADNSGSECSGISRITPAGVVTTFHNFESNSAGVNVDGLLPNPIIEARDGNFYGTARIGGAGQQGTFFRITPTGVFTVLFTFNADPVVNATPAASGAEPGAIIEGPDGNFYGLTEFGGVNMVKQPDGSYSQDAQGTLFRITPAGVLSVVHTFSIAEGVSNDISSFPAALVQGTDGSFYGAGIVPYDAAQQSNNAAPAVLYKVDQAGNLTILHEFAADGSDGSGVYGPFTAGPDGSFYGVALSSAPITSNYVFSNHLGTIFKVTSSGAFQRLFTFPNIASGNQVDQHITLGGDGNFYGTAKFGGTSPACTNSTGCGTIFQITPSGAFTVEHNFTGGTDSGFPAGPLVQTNNGTFIGTAYTTTAYNLAFSPGLPPPVQLSFSNTTTSANQPLVLTWKVLNAFSATMQQCHASVLPQGASTSAAGAGAWSGPQTGKLTGGVYTGSAPITPTASGTYQYILSCGGVETGTVTLTVGDGPVIQTTALANGSVSKPYAFVVQATGGTSPYLWGSAGTLPAGLSFDTNGNLFGTPKQFGVFQVTLGLQDSSTPPVQVAASFPLTILSTLALAPSLNNGVVGTAYTATATATGGVQTYKWVLTSGKLPDGLTFNTSSGVVSGTPTVVGKYTFTISVSDGEGTPAMIAQSYTISTAVPPLVFEPSTVNCTVLVTCSGNLEASGGTPPYTFTVLPSVYTLESLPSGLKLNPDGSFTGLPQDEVQTTPTFMVTDSASPAVSVTGAETFVIMSGLQIVSIPLPQATVGVPYQAPAPTATGGRPPYRWTVGAVGNPQLVNEYYADPATGALASKTAGPVSEGNFTLLYTLYDAETTQPSRTMNATLIVVTPPVTSVTTISSSAANTATGTSITLTAKVTATGGVPAGTVTFYNGTAPLGTVTLDATGTATFPTTFNTAGVYSLTATYSGGGSTTGSVSAPITETVVTPSVSASFSPGTLTVVSGSSGVLTLTLTPMNGFTGVVTFSCGTLPAHVSCTFAPPSLSIAAGAASATDTLTINTASTTTGLLRLPATGIAEGGVAMAMLLWLPGFSLRRRRTRTPRLLLGCLFGIALASVVTLSGCGGSNTFFASTRAAAGTYSIPVTLTLASGSQQVVTTTVVVQ